MDAEKLMDRGHQLAIAASMRVLAAHVALIANPKDPGQWFTTLGQNAFEYVDGVSNPQLDEASLKAVKEATYDTLRMIFDPTGFEK